MARRPTKTTTMRRSGPELSIVVPVFNEARSLEKLHGELVALARNLKKTRQMRFEIVYVDDGSRDETYRIASGLQADDVDIQVVALSRNFGKEAALLAGLDHARFGAVVFMDGDGQHPPQMVETLVSRWLDDGYDVVFTAKAHRANEPWLKQMSAKAFYAVLNWNARHEIPKDAGDFRLLSPRAVTALRAMPERNRFLKGMASWIGFRQVRVDYEPAPRAHGASNWGMRSLIGLSIEGLTSFSVAPLRLASLLGVLIAALALIFGFLIVLETVLYGKDVPGYPSLAVGLMVLGGVQLVMIGILGEYIGKLMWETKGRPVYFIAEHRLKTRADAERPAP
ncbi:MAG: glycosyltransferase family 2 protein [Pseudolabrys sp.]|nr:glycosyltransferase family 2 protein [Pseudolabrys sp.]